MTVRRLENEDEEKFWEAWIKDDLIFCYRYGKIGSAGGTKIKKFKTAAEAQAELEEKLQQKLDEGFSEPGAEEPEDEEEEEKDDDEDEADEEDEEAENGDDDEKEEAEASDDDEEDDSDDEDADEDDEKEEDEEDDDGDSEEDEDDEESEPTPPPPEPEKPTLPRRVHAHTPTAKDVEAAKVTLTAVAQAVGGRSWKVSHRARAAGRALARLGGIDPQSNATLAPIFEGLMGGVIAPKNRLSLDVALGLLWEVDAAAMARTVSGWRAKMLTSPASTSIGVLAATFDAIPDTEVAIHTGAALVERHLPADAWKTRFAKVLPFLEESLVKKGATLESLLSTLKPDGDPIVKSRVAAAADVKRGDKS